MQSLHTKKSRHRLAGTCSKYHVTTRVTLPRSLIRFPEMIADLQGNHDQKQDDDADIQELQMVEVDDLKADQKGHHHINCRSQTAHHLILLFRRIP